VTGYRRALASWGGERLWMTKAACKDQGDLFFADDGDHSRNHSAHHLARVKAAKAICATCPVRQPCLDLADRLETPLNRFLMWGIWGGETAFERYRRRRQLLPGSTWRTR
jgi:WhiB family transcriptional regulator, redox-sensing transcriptional regulator